MSGILANDSFSSYCGAPVLGFHLGGLAKIDCSNNGFPKEALGAEFCLTLPCVLCVHSILIATCATPHNMLAWEKSAKGRRQENHPRIMSAGKKISFRRILVRWFLYSELCRFQ